MSGGEGGNRTHDPGLAGILLFESRAFNRSATSPHHLPDKNPAGEVHLNDYELIIKIYEPGLSCKI